MEYAHPEIEPLKFYGNLGEYVGDVRVGGSVVSFTFDVDGYSISDFIVERVRAFLQRLEPLVQAAIEHVCQRMLYLKNISWLHPEELPITEAEFKSRLKLIQVWMDATGKRTLTFEDGGMFWGHDIVLDIGPNEEFERPDLYG
jgi:hypothetical protein